MSVYIYIDINALVKLLIKLFLMLLESESERAGMGGQYGMNGMGQ